MMLYFLSDVHVHVPWRTRWNTRIPCLWNHTSHHTPQTVLIGRVRSNLRLHIHTWFHACDGPAWTCWYWSKCILLKFGFNLIVCIISMRDWRSCSWRELLCLDLITITCYRLMEHASWKKYKTKTKHDRDHAWYWRVDLLEMRIPCWKSYFVYQPKVCVVKEEMKK